MERKIHRSGNSLTVSLPPSLLKAYGLREGDVVSIREDAKHGGILITPAAPPANDIDEAFAARVAGFIHRYRSTLESLAER